MPGFVTPGPARRVRGRLSPPAGPVPRLRAPFVVEIREQHS
ncbi:hypothetical protein YT1_2807 [Rhodococcus ruber]|nr:hypothetical protein YT1_2807 [Rhodococcus ruber]